MVSVFVVMMVLGIDCAIVTKRSPRRLDSFNDMFSKDESLSPWKLGIGGITAAYGLYKIVKPPSITDKIELLKKEVRLYENQGEDFRINYDLAFEGVKEALDQLEDVMRKMETKYAMKMNYLKTLVTSTFNLDGSQN